MKVIYHCLGCGKQDSTDVDLIKIIQDRTDDSTLINLIIRYIKQTMHTSCPEATLGIRTKPNYRQESD